MTLANFITILRLILVPAIIYTLLSGFWGWSCVLFFIASLSDSLDGFFARYYNQNSELGSYLDPLADKALLSSVFLVLGYMGGVPLWLVIAIVSRDFLIILAVVLSIVIRKPMKMRPLIISKCTTVAQILLAAFILFQRKFLSDFDSMNFFLLTIAGILTISSMIAYLFTWVRHMTNGDLA